MTASYRVKPTHYGYLRIYPDGTEEPVPVWWHVIAIDIGRSVFDPVLGNFRTERPARDFAARYPGANVWRELFTSEKTEAINNA